MIIINLSWSTTIGEWAKCYKGSSKWFLQVAVHPGRGVLPLHHVHVQRLLCPDRHGHRHPRLQVHRAQGVSFYSSLPRGTWQYMTLHDMTLLSLISRRSRVEFYQISSWSVGFRLQTDHTGRTLIPCWNVQSTCLISNSMYSWLNDAVFKHYASVVSQVIQVQFTLVEY